MKSPILAAAFATALAVPAAADTLRIQTHYAPETISGRQIQGFLDDIAVMSGGDLQIEMFFSSSVVKSVETFDAASSGILDCDMTGGAYQTGKNPAFQFVGDIMGGYDTPWQQYSWLYYGGGFEAADALYGQYNMKLIGWWINGQESMSSAKPIAGPADLVDWKFRSPPGLETEIFAAMGAKPIVMDFNEVFTALETGIIDGSDASSLANNVGMGLYDVVKHATYPGFHSMPSDHLACRIDAYEGLTEQNRRILDVAMQKLSFQLTMAMDVENLKAKAALEAAGVTIHDWAPADRAAFRAAAQAAWQGWADKTPEARALVDSHMAFLGQLGLIAN